MSDDLKRYKLVRGEPGYRDQMCVRPDGAWTLYEPTANRIAALEAEVDCPLGLDRGLWELCSAGTCPTCLAARLKNAEAERDRLKAEVARLTKKIDRALKGRAASRESERAAWAATEALKTEVARLRQALEASAGV